jgi:hypothetical protein
MYLEPKISKECIWKQSCLDELRLQRINEAFYTLKIMNTAIVRIFEIISDMYVRAFSE